MSTVRYLCHSLTQKQHHWVLNIADVIMSEFHVAKINNYYLGINSIHSAGHQDSEKFFLSL